MIQVIGAIDKQTRCKHYHQERDVIAIKFKCCYEYYSCYYCHEEAADHEAMVWPTDEWHTHAILCGGCGTELTVEEYLHCNYSCPNCRISFNPGCSNHNHLYFASK